MHEITAHVRLDSTSRSAIPLSSSGFGCLSCLFSSNRITKIGSGMTSRRTESTLYWFIRQAGKELYEVRGVDGDLLPTGDPIYIDGHELLESYQPELLLFEERMLPSIHRSGFDLDRLDDPELPLPSITIDESNVRAMFSLALDYLDARKAEPGRKLVGELLAIRTPFLGKDQHLFNGLGIALRKRTLYTASVSCYRRALHYTSRDEHLYYNLARAHYESGQWWDCMEALGKCFECNPDLTVSKGLVELISALARDPALRARYNKPPVPDGVARRAELLTEATIFSRPAEETIIPVDMGRRRSWASAQRQEASNRSMTERSMTERELLGEVGEFAR